MERSQEFAIEREKCISRMQEIVIKAEAENRPMNDEEQAEFDVTGTRADECGKQEKAYLRLEQLAASRAPEVVPGQPSDTRTRETAVEPRGESEVLDYERGLKNWLTFPFGDVDADEQRYAEQCGFSCSAKQIYIPFNRRRWGVPKGLHQARERLEKIREMREERAQGVVLPNTTTAGGYLVADEMMAAIDVAMEATSGMRQIARVISTNTGADLPIPTVDDTSNDGVLLAENAQVAEQDVTFGQVVLGAYKYSSKAVRVSRELLQDSNESIPGLLGELLGARLGRITNQHYTTGTGSGQPQGLAVASGGASDSGVTAASATVYTYAELLSIVHSVNPAYRASPSCAWMMNDACIKGIKSITDAVTGRPLWLESMRASQQTIAGMEPDTLLGYPVFMNVDMPTPAADAKSILFGDFSKFIIRDVAGISIMRLDERYAEWDQVCFLGFLRTDSDIVNTAAIKWADQLAS